MGAVCCQKHTGHKEKANRPRSDYCGYRACIPIDAQSECTVFYSLCDQPACDDLESLIAQRKNEELVSGVHTRIPANLSNEQLVQRKKRKQAGKVFQN